MSGIKNENVKKRERNRMEKKLSARKILVIVFVAGALLCGIGTGISLVEYSSFEYLGKKNIGGNDVETKMIMENLYRGTDGNGKVYIHSYYGEDSKVTVETSKDVPKDQIQFVVEYNPNNVKDIVIDREELEGNDPYYEGYYDSYYGDVEYSVENETVTASEEATTVTDSSAAQNGQQAGAQTDIQPQTYITYIINPVMAQESGLEVFFTYKDEILQNIKEKRFYEYEYPSIQSVKVLVHPSNKDVVSLY